VTRLSKVQDKIVNVVQDSADINKVAAEFGQRNADLEECKHSTSLAVASSEEANKFTTSLTLSASD